MDTPTHLYRHFDANGTLLYVGISLSAFHRLGQHRANSGWYNSIRSMTIESFKSRKLALEAERRAIRGENPLHNKQLKPSTFGPPVEAPKKEPNPVRERRSNRLTAKYIESIAQKLKSGEKVKQLHPDGNGLYLRTRPTGGMSFIVHQWGYKNVTLGPILIGLPEARRLALQLMVERAVAKSDLKIKKPVGAIEPDAPPAFKHSDITPKSQLPTCEVAFPNPIAMGGRYVFLTSEVEHYIRCLKAKRTGAGTQIYIKPENDPFIKAEKAAELVGIPPAVMKKRIREFLANRVAKEAAA